MNQLNETLRNEAIGLGLCQQWQNDWAGNKSHDELISMFLRGIDFCIEHNWPSSEWIVNNFTPQELHRNNVFVADNSVNAFLDHSIAFFKECEGTVTLNRFSVSTIHCVDCPNLTFVLKNGAKAFIHLHNSHATVDAEARFSTARVYPHTENCVINPSGNVGIRSPKAT